MKRSLLWLCAALAACGSSAKGGYAVEIRFASPALRMQAIAVEIHAVERCGAFAATGGDADGVITSGFIGQGAATMTLGGVPAGRFGLYAVARDASCRVIAAGCQEHTVALQTVGTVGVTLNAVTNGAACPNTSLCDRGFCGLQDGTGVCAEGTADCDRNVANRCEATLMTDAMNCGGCGQRCVAQNGTATCVAGACMLRCNDGRADCDMDPTNGCEVTLATDLANCGTCGIECPEVDNATQTCTAGRCGFFCNGTNADCDMNPTNGCEIDTRSSARNCGACGTVCTFPHANADCTDGVCGINGCMDGFHNCDGNPMNGCESSSVCP